MGEGARDVDWDWLEEMDLSARSWTELTIWVQKNEGYLFLLFSFLFARRPNATNTITIWRGFRDEDDVNVAMMTTTTTTTATTTSTTGMISPLFGFLRVELGNASDRLKALAIMGVTKEARRWWHLRRRRSPLVRTAISFTYRDDMSECWCCRRFGVRYMLLLSLDFSEEKDRSNVYNGKRLTNFVVNFVY